MSPPLRARARSEKPGGVCRSPALPRVARAAPHFGEEPCISGTRGSGAVFFTGCNLRCVFCQNREISRGEGGQTLSVPQLRDTLLRLRDQGVHNINLVTGAHFVRPIAEALEGLELGIPVVWNSSGYESVESLRLLEGLVQVYLPDFKYWKREPARRYSAAADYPAGRPRAIREMFRQVGPYVLDEDGMLRSGRSDPAPDPAGAGSECHGRDRLCRGGVSRGQRAFFPHEPVYPHAGAGALSRAAAARRPGDEPASDRLYAALGWTGYWQDPEAATDEMIPAFDGTGVS